MLEIMSNDDFEPEEGNCLRFIVGTSDTYVAKIYFLWMFDCWKSKEDFLSIPHIHIETMFSIWLFQEYIGAKEHFLYSFVDLFQN